MQGKYYEENMGLYTQLINVITFGGPHRVALLCMLQTHWFELINRLWNNNAKEDYMRDDIQGKLYLEGSHWSTNVTLGKCLPIMLCIVNVM